jgi:predicted phosphodiesterase
MDGPDPARRAVRLRAEGQAQPSLHSVKVGHRRSLGTLVARHAARVRSRRALLRGIGKAFGRTLLAALAALPFAVIWGIGHASIEDYLGPHRVHFASNFTGEIELDLGPIGNAYLRSPVGPVGVEITVGGIGSADESLNTLFSEQTLAAYTTLYAEPEEAVAGVVERLEQDAVVHGIEAEALLLLAFAGYRLRSQLLSPWVARRLTRRRIGAVYVTVVALVIGSTLVPNRPQGIRIPVTVAAGTRYSSLTVDSVLLADVLDRGIQGITLLSGRQQRAVNNYIEAAFASLSTQLGSVPQPELGETMMMGFSDLHCNQAMTELIKRLARATNPALVLSSGDDTVNGTAVERGCIRREAEIAGSAPFVVATGNHDSNITETQMRSNKMTVLDGSVVQAAGINVLGDDDPEHNIPFSVDRTRDRPETEEQLAERLVGVAQARKTDVILVHQPAASSVMMRTPNLPARLVLWGHFHAQAGPVVLTHDDGSWTVGMQEGTAGGVQQPTFTSFSTPFSPPLVSADVYFYFCDDATGLITAVQPVHFLPNKRVVIDARIPTGDLSRLPVETRIKLGGAAPTPTATPSGAPSR